MLSLLILAVCVLQGHDARLVNTTGSMDELGVCHCSVALPDTTFPADRLEVLETSNKNLGINVQQEITKKPSLCHGDAKLLLDSPVADDSGITETSPITFSKPESEQFTNGKLFADSTEDFSIQQRVQFVTDVDTENRIQSYQATLTGYLQRLTNLTRRVEIMETGGISYTQLDFELLKLEINEIEALVIKLRESIGESNVVVEAIYVEVQNISIMVNQLETYDKNNVLAVRRGIASLRKRLEDCEKNQHNGTTPAVNYGSCDHGGLVNISKPFLVQLNWLGFSYIFGGWGKDSYSGANQAVYWVAPLNTDGRMMSTLRFYPSYNNLLLYKGATEKVLTVTVQYGVYDYSSCGQGGGVIMYNNSLFYNCYNSRDICKLNVTSNGVVRKTLPNAVFNNRFSYSSSAWQDIDLAGDENGLWVVYSTEDNAGNIVISKLNSFNLTVEKTWVTSQYKMSATNTFMACGILYATRALNTRQEEIFYMYDTNTSQEGHISIILDKMMENVQSLSYNPNDRKLYMYNDAYLINYDLIFA